MKKIIFFLFTLILLIIAIAGLIFVYQISIKSSFEGEKEFTIEKGQSLNKISQNLYDQKFIKSPLSFKAYVFLMGWQASLQAGTYILTPINSIGLAKTLRAGKIGNEMSLKFIEGWTLKDMAEYLVKQKIVTTQDEFLNLVQVNNFKTEYDFLNNIQAENLEGFLFPDTYLVFKDAALPEVIKKMLDNFNQKLTPALRTEITAQGKNLYDILIMASIIEQEVPDDEDRKIVSGILWQRLDAGMPLQVDASLKYMIGKKDNPSLTFEELKTDSPYNTYKYKGLMPTPICNPGESAIRAAIYPKNSDYWYYLSTQKGETIFSKTLEEHNRAVDKYLR